MINLKFLSICSCLLFLVCLSCSGLADEYTAMKAEETVKEGRRDSLFLDLSLGMSKDDFYLACRKMNQDSIVKEGPRNLCVKYDLKDRPMPISMCFFPDFENERVSEMRIEFQYIHWDVWNEKAHSDKLKVEVLTILDSWYKQRKFIEIKHPKKKDVHVSIDHNRQIRVWEKDEQILNVFIKDLKPETAI